MPDIWFKFRIALLVLPKEVVAAIWRLILIILIGVLHFLKFLWERLRFKKKCKTKEWPRETNCCKVPEQVKRKPDPCIYSQTYRMSQGLSVTWDNPDIIVQEPGVGTVPSSALQPATNYIVRAKISNAAADPALATEVRCFYRPWSFNSPDTTPVEINSDGTEKVEIVHVPPWGSDTASFDWKTPDAAGHYCLLVECRHPDDINPNNNLGQENTNVIEGQPGETMSVLPMLFNRTDHVRIMRIFVDEFVIPRGEIELTLKKKKFPLRRSHLFDGLHKSMLVTDVRTAELTTQANAVPFITRYAYDGWDELKKMMRRGQHPVARVNDLKINGAPAEDGWAQVQIGPDASKTVPLQFTIPATALANDVINLNFTAVSPAGKVVGGVTVTIKVI